MPANAMDSARNCLRSCFFPEPTTLRIPTSLALWADLAVARLIKLMQATIRMINAIAAKMVTVFIFPGGSNSFSTLEYR